MFNNILFNVMNYLTLIRKIQSFILIHINANVNIQQILKHF